MSDPITLWMFVPVGYLLSVLVEMPCLLVGLSERHPLARRVLAGFWLTACTYPVVILVMPQLIDPGSSRLAYLSVAETFAPLAECLLFWAAFGSQTTWRDLTAITLANVASFAAGEWLHAHGWLTV
jgi:hypothetical protein